VLLLDLCPQFDGGIVLGFCRSHILLDNVVSCTALSRQPISSPNMPSCMESLLTAAFWWFEDSNFGRLSPFTSAVNPAKSCLDPSTIDVSSLQACA